jgi:hypothetical protein
MASRFNSLLNTLGAGFNLKDTARGFLRPKGQMGDWQHAARTFADDNFRLAPKAKFLYHVYFDINRGALKNQELKDRNQNEIGLLVKAVDLPKYTVKTMTLNQYNRKRVVQLSHDRTAINFRFHDDRAHIVNKLWQNYYSYYYADPTVGQSKYYPPSNATKGSSEITVNYGFDNNSSIPFFNQIILYQLNNRQYVSYTLINPLIATFNHDSPNSAEQGGGTSECSMSIAYEGISYDIGTVDSGKVKGFAQDHYDKNPSPLSPAGGGTKTIFGEGGVLAGIGSVADSINKGNYLTAGISAINTYQNAKGLTKAGIASEGTSILGGLAAAGAGLAVGAAISGIKDTVFPSKSVVNTTKANPIDYP